MTRRQTAGAVRHRSAELRHNWQKAPPGMTPDPCDREFRSIQVEHAGSAECILRRSMRGGCSAGLRPAPATSWSNSNSRSWFPVGSRAGSGCGGRCKYVHVSSVAASMRLTPPQPDPPRLRQISAICLHFCRAEPCSAQFVPMSKYSISIDVHPHMARVYQYPSNRHRETVEGGAVSDCGVSAAWMPRPSPQGRVYGVPAIRHRPAQPTENPEPLWLWLWLWPLPWQVQGAALPTHPSPAHENDFTVFSKPSSLRHASTILRSSMRPRATHAKKRPPIA